MLDIYGECHKIPLPLCILPIHTVMAISYEHQDYWLSECRVQLPRHCISLDLEIESLTKIFFWCDGGRCNWNSLITLTLRQPEWSSDLIITCTAHGFSIFTTLWLQQSCHLWMTSIRKPTKLEEGKGWTTTILPSYRL